MDDFLNHIIPWQRITSHNQFCLTKPGTVVLDSMAFLSNIEEFKELLLAVLNSNVIYFWICSNVHEYGNAGFRLANQYVENISIPLPNEELKVLMARLVNHELESPNIETERQINQAVYKLFELSENEIQYIEHMVR